MEVRIVPYSGAIIGTAILITARKTIDPIGDEGAKGIAEGLKSNKVLTWLSVSTEYRCIIYSQMSDH